MLKFKNHYLRLYLILTLLLIIVLQTISVQAFNTVSQEYKNSFTNSFDPIENSDTQKVELPALNYNILTDSKKMIYNYCKSIDKGDWSSWASYYIPSLRETYLSFVTNEDNQKNHRGILNISSLKIISIDKVDNCYAPKYRELENYQNNDTSYECYMIGYDINVHEKSKYYFDGINYKLVLLVNDNGNWGVGVTCGCPIELLEDFKGTYPVEDAISDYSDRSLSLLDNNTNIKINNTKTVQVTGFINGSNIEPFHILAGYDPNKSDLIPEASAYYDVDFSLFYENVTFNEVGQPDAGGVFWDSDVIIAQAMAAKMTSWWCYLGNFRDAQGCDILANHDVAYDPNDSEDNIPQTIRNYVNTIRNIGVKSTYGYFYMPWYQGTYSYPASDTQNSGILRQYNAKYLADLGYSWQYIIHYYYNNSAYNNPTTGIVNIFTSVTVNKLVSGKVYNIRCVQSGKYLTVSGGATGNTTNVIQATYDTNTAYQEWLIVHIGNGEYIIKDINSGKYLSIDANSSAAGANAWI